MKNILTSQGGSFVEIKKSKFIGFCAPVETEAEARGVIERIRAEQRGASHNVYAYGVVTGEGQQYTRHSDDGEPQGTSGLPVLNVFVKNGIDKFVCVVTRYFGGTLLGTGGLVRAYTQAAKEAMEAAGVAPLIRYASYVVTVPYSEWDKLSYDFKKAGLVCDKTEFTDKCAAYLTVPETLEAAFMKIAEPLRPQTNGEPSWKRL